MEDIGVGNAQVANRTAEERLRERERLTQSAVVVDAGNNTLSRGNKGAAAALAGPHKRRDAHQLQAPGEDTGGKRE